VLYYPFHSLLAIHYVTSPVENWVGIGYCSWIFFLQARHFIDTDRRLLLAIFVTDTKKCEFSLKFVNGTETCLPTHAEILLVETSNIDSYCLHCLFLVFERHTSLNLAELFYCLHYYIAKSRYSSWISLWTSSAKCLYRNFRNLDFQLKRIYQWCGQGHLYP